MNDYFSDDGLMRKEEGGSMDCAVPYQVATVITREGEPNNFLCSSYDAMERRNELNVYQCKLPSNMYHILCTTHSKRHIKDTSVPISHSINK